MNGIPFRGQDLQDKWIFNLFGYGGIFVDIGAFDGLGLSNTQVLEKYCGWKGLLVEGDSRKASLCSKNRESKTVCALLSDEDCPVTFYIVPNDPMLSTINSKIASDMEYETETRKCYDAGSFLKSHCTPEEFSYLSIDVEGVDHKVLKSILDIGFKPFAITIEINKLVHTERKEFEKYLNSMGYIVDQKRVHDWYVLREDLKTLP